MKKGSGKIAGPVLFGLILLSAVNLSGQHDYRSPEQVDSWCKSYTQAHQKNVELIKLATSPGGHPIHLLEIKAVQGKNEAAKPAVLVVANMNGLRPITTEGAIYLCESLVADPAALQKRNYYVVPSGNPDAAARYFDGIKMINPGNQTPTNDDLDENTDEDGPEDLNGDGMITMMRQKHPEGTMVTVADEPRLMRKADQKEGETGIYRMISEGTDNDGDGACNEDGPGGTNVNLNFPHLFDHFDPGTGLYPGSTPESRSLMEYVFDHPEIAMAVAFGETNFCLQPPKGGRTGDADLSKIEIPERYLSRLNAEKGKTYTMEEVIEMVKPIVPAGIEVNEILVTGFLGLGAAVNPLPGDLSFYMKFSKDYKTYLEEKGVKAGRLGPETAKDGSFELWAYYHLGVPVFSMDLFWVDKPEKKEKEEDGNGADPREMALLAYSDNVLHGKGFVNWEKFDHPDLGEVEIGGFIPYLQSTPPYEMVDSLLEIQVPWILHLADQLPELAIYQTKVTPKGAGVYQLEVWTQNKGFLPFPTDMGKRNTQPAPAILVIGGEKFELLEGYNRTSVNSVPGNSRVKNSWLIKADKTADLEIRLNSIAAGTDVKTIKLGSQP